MRNLFLVFTFATLLLACKSEKLTKISFLDEFVIEDSTAFNNSVIGGLSGIDFVNNKFYFVVDDARKPRVFRAKIEISNNKINAVNFEKVVFLKDSISNFYKENALDLESIFVDDKTNEMYLVSEGSIRKNKMPSIFKVDEKGIFIHDFPLPKNLSIIENIKHNAVFEASSKSVGGKDFWVAMEAPLKVDGDEPTFIKTQSPIRITFFDKTLKKATKQFAYQLEHITKPAKGNINVNGATAMLEYKKNHFFIVERTYQNGYGSFGNIVRIFDATIDEKTTNILEIDALKETEFVPLKKKLIFSFDTIRDKLTKGIVDNIEGITFGPELSNGNQSLILVSDDNFQIYGKQLNQFILLEINK